MSKHPSVLHARPRPRLLLLGFSPGEADRFKSIYPTVHSAGSADDARDMCHPQEIDLVVSRTELGEFSQENHVVLIGAPCTPYAPVARTALSIVPGDGEELAENPDAPLPWVQRTLPETIPEARSRTVITALGSEPKVTRARDVLRAAALLSSLRPAGPVAAVYLREQMHPQGRRFGVAWFPNGHPDPLAIVAAVVDHWRQEDPAAFPPGAEWPETLPWATKGQTTAMSQLAEFMLTRSRRLAELDREQAGHEARLAAAHAAGRAGEQRLLLAQGAELVVATMEAFRRVGFTVKDADRALAPGAPKREDIRLVDQSSGWTALVEVKGYNRGGAKTNDLTQLERHARFYVEAERRQPDRLIYVVNSQCQEPPDIRQQPFVAGGREDFESFATAGGLVVWTPDLFRLLRDLDDTLSPSDARAMFMDRSSSRLRWPRE